MEIEEKDELKKIAKNFYRNYAYYAAKYHENLEKKKRRATEFSRRSMDTYYTCYQMLVRSFPELKDD
jgi:hypothetical protein